MSRIIRIKHYVLQGPRVRRLQRLSGWSISYGFSPRWRRFPNLMALRRIYCSIFPMGGLDLRIERRERKSLYILIPSGLPKKRREQFFRKVVEYMAANGMLGAPNFYIVYD